jgi:hypothetical protein
MRPLGKTGLSISPTVFGGNVFGWTVDENTSFDLLDDLVGSAKAVAQRKRLNDATCSTQCREGLRRKPPDVKIDVSKCVSK